jgi:hypothetical protein
MNYTAIINSKKFNSKRIDQLVYHVHTIKKNDSKIIAWKINFSDQVRLIIYHFPVLNPNEYDIKQNTADQKPRTLKT